VTGREEEVIGFGRGGLCEAFGLVKLYTGNLFSRMSLDNSSCTEALSRCVNRVYMFLASLFILVLEGEEILLPVPDLSLNTNNTNTITRQPNYRRAKASPT